jgi:superfamily II DNA or RNA helicase
MSRFITLAKNAFLLRFPYDASLVAAVRSIPRRRFDGVGKVWEIAAIPENAAPLAAFAADHGFAVEESAAARIVELSAPQVATPNISAEWVHGAISAFLIKTPSFNGEQNSLIKSAGSARWDGEAKVWRVGWSLAACCVMERLSAEFGLTIAPGLAEHVQAQLDAQEGVIELSRAADVDMIIPAPAGQVYLPFQKAGIAYANKMGNALIGDDMGLGKTIQAIGVSNSDAGARRILIICPASLKINWAREWAAWDVKGLSVGTVDGGKVAQWPASADVVIINFDLVGKHLAALRATPWDILIVDEAHNLRNPKALRTKRILGMRAKDGSFEAEPLPAKRLLFLTGTAIVNRPVELWPLISALAPTKFNNFFAFAKRYCGAVNDGYGWNFKGATNLHELQNELRASCMVRRLKADVLKELPPKTRQIIRLDAADIAKAERKTLIKIRDKLAELEAEKILAFLADDRDAYDHAVTRLKDAGRAAFEEMAELRHATSVAKVPHVVALVKEALEQGKVILFAHHKDVVAAYAQAFGAAAVVIDGSTPIAQRQAAVDRFQSDDSCTVAVISILAGGVGLTLTASSHVIFAELDWVPGNVSQAEDRAHRYGQKDNVLVWHVVVDGTIDAHMAKVLVFKQGVIDKALNDADDIKLSVDLDAAAPISPLGEGVLLPEFQKISAAELGAWLEAEDARDKMTHDQAIADRAAKRAADRGFGKEATHMTAAQIAAVRANLGALAAVCDGAIENDAMGFSGVDAKVGHALARLAELEPIQAAFARAMLGKYKRQLGADAIKAMSA